MGAEIEERRSTGPGDEPTVSPSRTSWSGRRPPRRRPRAGRRRGGDRRDPVLCLAAAVAAGTTTVRRRGRAAPQGIRPDRRDRGRASRALGARVAVDGDDIADPRRRAAPGRRHRQPRRPPAGHDLRDRRPHRRRADTIVAARLAPPSPIPASSTNSKGCGHDQARRPHRPSGGAFAVGRDAAGRLRRARASTHATSSGTARRSSSPTRSPSCAATTSWAPTSRSRTRSGSSRCSTA